MVILYLKVKSGILVEVKDLYKLEGTTMKLAKKLFVMIVGVMMMFSLTACGESSEEASVKLYTMDGTFNSETVNRWRNLYLVDEETYILELEVLDSQDPTKHTVEFVMRGYYTDNGDGTITLSPGWGNGYAMNGTQKFPCITTDEEWNSMFKEMFGVNGATTFTLKDDGTYVPAE